MHPSWLSIKKDVPPLALNEFFLAGQRWDIVIGFIGLFCDYSPILSEGDANGPGII